MPAITTATDANGDDDTGLLPDTTRGVGKSLSRFCGTSGAWVERHKPVFFA